MDACTVDIKKAFCIVSHHIKWCKTPPSWQQRRSIRGTNLYITVYAPSRLSDKESSYWNSDSSTTSSAVLTVGGVSCIKALRASTSDTFHTTSSLTTSASDHADSTHIHPQMLKLIWTLRQDWRATMMPWSILWTSCCRAVITLSFTFTHTGYFT